MLHKELGKFIEFSDNISILFNIRLLFYFVDEATEPRIVWGGLKENDPTREWHY